MGNNVINNMYDFMIIFDAKNSNPNGDPDKNNMPRQNDDTGKGIVTDACIKRKIRNYIEVYNETLSDEDKQAIFINMDDLLNNKIAEGIKVVSSDVNDEASMKKLKDTERIHLIKQKASSYICKSYYDVRAFGAMLGTGEVFNENNDISNNDNSIDNDVSDNKDKTKKTKKSTIKGVNSVRGPVQISMATSIDPINPIEVSITRQAITNEKDEIKRASGNGTFGSKWVVPYGLYVATGNVSPFLANKTGFTEDDLELLWQSIVHMFDFDKSVARPEMYMRKLIIFKHDSKLGNVASHKLFDSVHINKKSDVTVPDNYNDYIITIDDVPEGVVLEVRD